jgi:hypothetical protein
MQKKISQRTFLKSAAGVFIPATFGIFIPKAKAQGYYYAKPAAGASCSVTISNTDPSTSQTTFGGGNLYAGQANWQRPSAITICSLEFEVQNNGSSRNWFVAIYTQTGANLNLGGQVAISAALPGANWAAKTRFGGPLITPFAPANATNYSLVIFPETAMGGNDIFIGVDDLTTLSGGGNREVFSAAGTASFASGNDVNIWIGTQ